MILKSIAIQKQELISNSRVIFKTTIGSGICVREHDRNNNKDKYYVYSDNEFIDKIKSVVMNQVRRIVKLSATLSLFFVKSF